MQPLFMKGVYRPLVYGFAYACRRSEGKLERREAANQNRKWKVEDKGQGDKEPDRGVMDSERDNQGQEGGHDQGCLHGGFPIVVAPGHQHGDDFPRRAGLGPADRLPNNGLLFRVQVFGNVLGHVCHQPSEAPPPSKPPPPPKNPPSPPDEDPPPPNPPPPQ